MGRYKLSNRKLDFACFYFLPESETRYNYYRSALKASFSDSYARKISWRMNWIELATLTENQGIIVLDDNLRKYAQKCQKMMVNDGI